MLRGPAYVKTASPTNHQNQWKNDVILDCSLSKPYMKSKLIISSDCIYGFDRLKSRKIALFHWFPPLTWVTIFTRLGPLNIRKAPCGGRAEIENCAFCDCSAPPPEHTFSIFGHLVKIQIFERWPSVHRSHKVHIWGSCAHWNVAYTWVLVYSIDHLSCQKPKPQGRVWFREPLIGYKATTSIGWCPWSFAASKLNQVLMREHS